MLIILHYNFCPGGLMDLSANDAHFSWWNCLGPLGL